MKDFIVIVGLALSLITFYAVASHMEKQETVQDRKLINVYKPE